MGAREVAHRPVVGGLGAHEWSGSVVDAYDGGVDRQAVTDRLPRSATWAAVLGGALLAAVPTFVADLFDDSAGGTWVVVLGSAGLFVVGIGFWFGVTTRQSVGWKVIGRLCVGAALGTFLSVMIVDGPVEGMGFLPILVAGLVFVVFWLPGSIGIGLGTMAYRFRTGDEQQVRDKIRSGYYEPGGDASTSSGSKSVLDLEPGDTFTDSTGIAVTITSVPEIVSNEVLVAVRSTTGRGLRRWHISQLDDHGTGQNPQTRLTDAD